MSFKERTDVTAVPAMGVVAETMMALVLASRGPAQVRRRLGRGVPAQPPRAISPRWARPLRRRSRRPMADRIILVGMMGAGKTTVGRLLAAAPRLGHFDSDAQVMASTGRTVPELFAERGEAAFRAEESRVLAEALSVAGPGGGVGRRRGGAVPGQP